MNWGQFKDPLCNLFSWCCAITSVSYARDYGLETHL